MKTSRPTFKKALVKTLQNLIFGILFLKMLFRVYNIFIFIPMFQWALLEFSF